MARCHGRDVGKTSPSSPCTSASYGPPSLDHPTTRRRLTADWLAPLLRKLRFRTTDRYSLGVKKRRVLLCTSNGAGLGHVTRMMAVAERLGPEFDITLFTLSAALPIPVAAGIHVEHLPSAGYIDVPTTTWHELLEDRMEGLIHRYRPDVIVFDGVHPYRGLTNILRRRRRRKFVRVWMRRGMWRPGVGVNTPALAEFFDHVIEPGEYAHEFDMGATSSEVAGIHRVGPVCYSGPEPMLDRTAACRRLGLDPTATNALLQLGAGTINDLDSTLGSIVAELTQRGVTVTLARSVLSADEAAPTDSVVVVREFPISRSFRAFDFAAIATGYNSFHEVLSMAVPSILVPNLHTKTDDQDARSRWADVQGLGYRWDGHDDAELKLAVEAMTSAGTRSEMRRRLELLPPATGASDVAELLTAWTNS